MTSAQGKHEKDLFSCAPFAFKVKRAGFALKSLSLLSLPRHCTTETISVSETQSHIFSIPRVQIRMPYFPFSLHFSISGNPSHIVKEVIKFLPFKYY